MVSYSITLLVCVLVGKTKVYLKDSGKSVWGRAGKGMGGHNCKILERAPAGEGDDSFSTQLGSWTCVFAW